MAKDREYIETRDGREIPFSILSSGQQEILPLYMALNLFLDDPFTPSAVTHLVYIEEPEAHLFPLSQKRLVEYLASRMSRSKDGAVDMLITTHSPYVLSTLNNLIKAGSLVDRYGRSARGQIGKIVAQPSWLMPNTVAAYSLHDGRTTSLITKEGLIDAAYLDEVSGTIAGDFFSLLEIENRHDADPKQLHKRNKRIKNQSRRTRSGGNLRKSKKRYLPQNSR
jgi:hypothetical protein